MAYYTYPLGELYPDDFGGMDYMYPVPVMYQGRQICRTTPDKKTGFCHIADVEHEVFQLLMEDRLEIQAIFDRWNGVRLVELRLVRKNHVQI